MRSERWSIRSEKYGEECGGGLVVREEASLLKQPGASFMKLCAR